MAIYRLGDVATYVEGYVNPQISDPSNFGEGIIGWLKVADLNHGNIVCRTEMTLSNKSFDMIKKSNQIFKKGSIVWSKSGSVGLCSLLGIDVTANRGILNIIPNQNIENKYLYFCLLKKKDYFSHIATGAVLKHLYGPKLMETMVDVPDIGKQQEIIDIIERDEELFLKYSNLVRIDNVENCQKDMKNLIDIIEPVENLINNVDNQINVVKNVLLSKYNYCSNDFVRFCDIITLHTKSYSGQAQYIATSAIGEFSLNTSKVQNVTLENKPSRANITPYDRSFIISKLDGENKVYYVGSNFPYVVSTGFFNLTSEYIDHISGFVLSEDYISQKSIFSTGTTMLGLNNKALGKIQVTAPDNNSKILTELMLKLLEIRANAEDTKCKIINLLIK